MILPQEFLVTKEFAPRLARLLKRSKLTQTELAQRLRVHESTVSLWLAGKNMPRIERLEEIAKLLGGDFAELLEGVLARKKRAA